jgi:hypothetical protein
MKMKHLKTSVLPTLEISFCNPANIESRVESCCLTDKFPLVRASAVTLGSELRGAHDRILRFHDSLLTEFLLNNV